MFINTGRIPWVSIKKLKLLLVAALIIITAGSVLLPFNQSQKAYAPDSIYGGPNKSQLITRQDSWYTLGAFTAGATTPAVTARTAATFNVTDPNNIIYIIRPEWNAVRVRLSTTTDGDSTVTDVFLMSSESDHYSRVATLTWTTGTQTATTSGQEYADTVVESNAHWHKTASSLSPTGNYIAEWFVDVMGSKMIGLCPTTYANATTVEITGY